jgi:glyoxylase-like metal-dependent hydrolase (beta-lactamase superfamily II)
VPGYCLAPLRVRVYTRAVLRTILGLSLLFVTLTAAPAFAQVDFSGVWAVRYHEDQIERVAGSELGDYLGLPLNDAARLRADSWDAELHALPEWQCRPHATDYIWRSVQPARIWKDVEPVTGAVTAFHVSFQDVLQRTIYMDGRPHPPAEAAHTWAGFSTGKWEGDMLTVSVTHLKEGYIRRNGPPRSDLATVTEHWLRHGDYLTIVQIVDDPIYLDEPFIQTTDFALDLHQQPPPIYCEIEEETERPKGSIPHHLPGSNHAVEEFAQKHRVPVAAVRGGVETTYPAFRKTMTQADRPSAAATRPVTNRSRANDAPATDIRVLKVRENVSMLSGAGGNITVLTFPQGVLLVDTGLPQMTDQVLATIKRLSDQPITHIINTHVHPDHTGGNAALAMSGRKIAGDEIAGDSAGGPEGATIIAHENVLMKLSAPSGTQPPAPSRAWPSSTYHHDTMKLSAHFHGGEAIQIFHEPAAHTNGDSVVLFRRADVIMTGDIFSTTSYPVIDVAAGGSINGVIAALNHVLDLAFPEFRTEGGTMVIPGHGRLCDAADVGYYRDMVTIIRDRVQDAIAHGQTLEQVKAAGLTRDYDPRYGATTGPWTTDMFVEAVYKSLSAKQAKSQE